MTDQMRLAIGQFNQLTDEKLQFIRQLGVKDVLLVNLRRRFGQQHARLDLHQGRRQHQKITHRVRVQRLEQPHVLQILTQHPSDRDIVDVHLVPADQVQQQIHRPAVAI